MIDCLNMDKTQKKVYSCPVCAFCSETQDGLDAHTDSRRHFYNKTLQQFKNNSISKTKNRHGVVVEVTCSPHNVTYSASNGSSTVIVNLDVTELTFQLTLKNSKNPLELMNVRLLHPLEYFSLEIVTKGTHSQILDRESRNVHVKFTNPGYGIFSVPVCFMLKKIGHEFQIIKYVVIEVTSEQVIAMPFKESPFTGEAWYGMKALIPAVLENGVMHQGVTEYSIPKKYLPIFDHNLFVWCEEGKQAMTEQQLELLEQIHESCPRNSGYDIGFKDVGRTFFHTMLYFDEYTTLRHLRHYHMTSVQLHIPISGRVELKVPGLAEKRPSVIKGDIVRVRVRVGPDSWETIEYEGVIAEVRDTVVWIKGFHERLFERLMKSGDELRFDVRFLFNRYPMFLMHRALDIAYTDMQQTVLFPERVELLPSLVPNDQYSFFNKQVHRNPEQKLAIQSIVRGQARPAPYIVFGPPGTGKTNTIVEAILQVKTLFQSSFILVCAPSNAACDFLAQKLIEYCSPKELLRLISSSRDHEAIPYDLMKYSNAVGLKPYTPKELQDFRIIVCTLITAGSKLVDKQESPFHTTHHFTHVFIDEAGQAMEPEVLVALAGVLGPPCRTKPGGQLILAGDPKQLGPICISQLCEDAGLGVSLLERLMMHCPLYQRDQKGNFNSLYITKLLDNFRSHPSLLHLPNKLFYAGELKPCCGPEILNDPISTMPLLSTKATMGHSCIFHGVIGQEQREGKSPSFYNQQEIDVVMQYLQELLCSNCLVNVKQSDIGIISPYIRQVYKMKARCTSMGWKDIEVGTTETFQGREKRIIVISTVRSNRNLLDYDKKFKLGFLVNKKRFNVAITRARSLLIVIGCPHILELDKAWVELIQYSQALGSYKGCKYTLQSDSWMDEVLNRLVKPIVDAEY